MNNLTEFEQATANQIAIENGKEKPTDKNIADAKRLVKKWNDDRGKLNLKGW